MKKALVLGRKYRAHKHFRDFVEMDDQLLLPALVEDVGDHLRLQRELRQSGLIAQGDDTDNASPMSLNRSTGLNVSVLPRINFNSVAQLLVPPEVVGFR